MPLGRSERKEIHSWASESLKKLEALENERQFLISTYRERLQKAHRRRQHTSVAFRLRKLSIEEAVGPRAGFSFKALYAEKVHTAYDLRRIQTRLHGIKGIGPTRAATLMDALRRAEQLTASDLRPPADPAEWNESDVELVHVLFMFSQALSLSKSPQWSDLQSLTEDLRSVKQSARLQSWLFGGDRRKQQIRDIYQTTRQRALSSLIVNATETMAHKIKDTRQADDRLRNSAELITVWRNSSATLLSLLEQFTAEEGSPQEKAAVLRGVGRSFLPMDLAERIQAQSLDLQLVMKTIRPYQQFGAKFALTVRQALLGDKMGLGKTIEALAAIAHAITHEKQFHHLVICPASLIENWLQEIIETLPTIPGLAFREPDAERTFQRWQRDGGIILVSFQQAAKLAEKDLPSIGFVIVDEAHYVKNPDANRTRATATLVRLGQRALLMGGTPMENRAAEFINLVDLVSSSEGKKLKQRFGDGRRAHLDGDRFRREIAHLYLRRNQKDVLDELPPLIAQDEVIQVGSAERSAYQSALLEGNLMAARALLSSANDTDSAKMERLSQISEECRRNERKLLVFSYFRDVLTTARKVIGEECGEISGGVTIVDRHRLVTEFNARAGFAALVLQIDVGSAGLNLQSASVVVIMEPQYKPSTERQAVARAYRMGQTNRVMVHRLVAKNSVDTALVKLTKFKAHLFDTLVHHSDLADDLDKFQINEGRLLADEQKRLAIESNHE